MWWLAAGTTYAADDASVDVHGYVEAYGSHNFGAPSNDVTALRGFDGRADTFTLSNVAVDATGADGPVSARVVLQVGQTPSTYYAAEPSLPASGGVGPSDATLWRNVQQAYAAWQATNTVGFEAGLYLSPVGPEAMAVKDDWNFSRSDLFYALPFYHAGAEAIVAPDDAWKLLLGVCNGWNAVVDDNDAKSLHASVGLTSAPVTAQLLYLGGVERSTGAPEGQPWRHLGDLYVQVDATSRVSFLVHADVGLERNAFGDSSWEGGAFYVRAEPIGDVLYVAVRGDVLREVAASDDDGAASTIFWPATDADGVARVASATLTVDWRPADHLSLRLEGRADAANADMYFAGRVRRDDAGHDVPNARDQRTVTVGAVAWF